VAYQLVDFGAMPIQQPMKSVILALYR